MRVTFYSAHAYDIAYFEGNQSYHQFSFVKERLDLATARYAEGMDAICIASTDVADKAVITMLNKLRIGLIIVRSSGLDNIDTNAADNAGIALKCLPGYSPQAIAEHAAALLLTLNRNIHLARERVLKGDFSIEGLMGFNLYNKTVGIVGIGRVGYAFSRIMKGFGCRILGFDTKQNLSAYDDIQLVSFVDLLQGSDIISLHCSLNDTSKSIINAQALELIKPGALLINVAQGKLVDTKAVLTALNKGTLGAYVTDVYEDESNFFYQTFQSIEKLTDPLLKMLIQHPNVLLTSHQAFFTKEAMQQMTCTIINELTYYESLTGGLADRLII